MSGTKAVSVLLHLHFPVHSIPPSPENSNHSRPYQNLLLFRQAVKLGRTEYSEEKVQVSPVTTAEYGVSKAARPFNSRLDKSKLVKNGFKPLPTWQDAVERYLKEIEF